MENLAKFLVKLLHQNADMTLCTSPQLRDSLVELGLKNVDVWRKGINTKVRLVHFEFICRCYRLYKFVLLI